MAGHGTAHIYESLFANAVITAAKGVGAALTGSGAMLAETIHSAADCGNQVLLLWGVSRSRRPPDETHPLGYGRALYFWSFMVALMLFLGGGMFSIYEGVHKWKHPEAFGSLRLAVIILLFSLAIEGWATVKNVIEIRRRAGNWSVWRYLRSTKDLDLVVVFGENSAAVLSLLAALAALAAAAATGDGRWDAAGSVAVGGVLVAVSVFLAVEVKSLLIGEAADPAIARAVTAAAAADSRIRRTYALITVQQGPGESLAALKLACDPALTTAELSRLIDAFEDRLRAASPECKWLFVEPDLGRDA